MKTPYSIRHTLIIVGLCLSVSNAFAEIFADRSIVLNRRTGKWEYLRKSYDSKDWYGSYLGVQTYPVIYIGTGEPHRNVVQIPSPPGPTSNPCGIPLGETAKFCCQVSGVPHEDISWSIKSGEGVVAFVNGTCTGPEVSIFADAEGTFTLEVDVRGLIITPPHVRPFFEGTVLQKRTIPVTVWVVSNTDGSSPADATRISAMIADANKRVWPTAMTLAWGGTINTVTNNAWHNLQRPLDPIPTNSLFRQLVDLSSGTRGIEIYFVNTIANAMNQPLGGVNNSGGLVLSAVANGHILAHEILHQCGLRDIYVSEDGIPFSVTGGLTQERLTYADWGGGYYPPGIQMTDFITGKLLMYGMADPQTPTTGGIPRGSVYGLSYEVISGERRYYLGMVPVGLSDMRTRQPMHE